MAASSVSVRRPSASSRLLRIDRGPNWLFVKLSGEELAGTSDLTSELWGAAERHFIYRMVLELEALSSVTPELSAELAQLDQRLAAQGGALRLCGLNDRCLLDLQKSHLGQALRHHSTRAAAVVGD